MTCLTSGHDMLIVATRNGRSHPRFNEEDARPMGRNGHGVRAIRLAEGDEVVGVCICREGGMVLTVTENGKGRRSDIDTYRITARGGKGHPQLRCEPRQGCLREDRGRCG